MRSTDWVKGALFGIVATAALGAGVGVMAHERHRGSGIIVDRQVFEQGIAHALDELADLERLNDASRDRRTKKQIHQRIHHLRNDLSALDEAVAAAYAEDGAIDGDGIDTPIDPDRSNPYAFSEAELRQVIAALDAASSSASKLAVIRDALNGRWLTCAQLVRLMDELAFSSDRVDVAVLLYGNLSDPESFYTVYSHLPFDADRQALRKRLGK